jgi:hypothetical protein
MKKEHVLGIVRHTLTFVGGLWVMKGFIDENILSETVGGIITAIGGIWSIVDKTKKN